MAQTTILAAGTTAATSSDFVLADGQTKTVGLFATGTIPSNVACPVMIDTPGDDQLVYTLTAANPVLVLSGPGTYRVQRPVVSVAVGIFTEG